MEETTLKVEDFNGKVVRLKSLPSFYQREGLAEEYIGITFKADEDADEFKGGDGCIHIHYMGKLQVVYFERFKITTLEIVDEPVPAFLKQTTLAKLQQYHLGDKDGIFNEFFRYIDNLHYLEAMCNINKMKVIG